MNKKFYFEPESEVIELNMMSAILVGSEVDDDGGEAPDLGKIDDPYVDPDLP